MNNVWQRSSFFIRTDLDERNCPPYQAGEHFFYIIQGCLMMNEQCCSLPDRMNPFKETYEMPKM
ncbi:MAG: hypothetical protein D3925_02880 [Candidatus Electrothrix sp. AR5]|nr:hypothetical protein [Candidatus Electrothrix sp. AR5]